MQAAPAATPKGRAQTLAADTISGEAPLRSPEVGELFSDSLVHEVDFQILSSPPGHRVGAIVVMNLTTTSLDFHGT
jgi:hypothetical protein